MRTRLAPRHDAAFPAARHRELEPPHDVERAFRRDGRLSLPEDRVADVLVIAGEVRGDSRDGSRPLGACERAVQLSRLAVLIRLVGRAAGFERGLLWIAAVLDERAL